MTEGASQLNKQCFLQRKVFLLVENTPYAVSKNCFAPIYSNLTNSIKYDFRLDVVHFLRALCMCRVSCLVP